LDGDRALDRPGAATRMDRKVRRARARDPLSASWPCSTCHRRRCEHHLGDRGQGAVGEWAAPRSETP